MRIRTPLYVKAREFFEDAKKAAHVEGRRMMTRAEFRTDVVGNSGKSYATVSVCPKLHKVRAEEVQVEHIRLTVFV